MKALSCITPGLFRYTEMEKPVLKDGHSVLKIRKIGICGTDYHAFDGSQPFFSYPRILGHEVAATVAETTAGSGFEIGELVTISPYYYCGHCIACRSDKTNCCARMQVSGVHVDGAMAEFFQVPDGAIVKGNGLSADELVLVEPLAIGAHGISKASLKYGERVLVIGAGPIGLGVINLAMIAGAEVIVLDVNEERLDFCKSKLGVNHIINATDAEADILQRIIEITTGDMPTVIIDCSGNLKAINGALQFLAHGGRMVLIGLQKHELIISHPEFHKREATLMSSRNACPQDFDHVIDCIKKGKIDPENFITHRVHFDEVAGLFPALSSSKSGVIKAVIEFDSYTT